MIKVGTLETLTPFTALRSENTNPPSHTGPDGLRGQGHAETLA